MAEAYEKKDRRARDGGRRSQDLTSGTGPVSGDGQQAWEERARLVVTPIAAPSILGLFAFAGATLIVGSHVAGWWGTPEALNYAAPFAAVFGGIAQFFAGMWAYRARDGIATAMHGMWGSFWIAFGILHTFYATGVLEQGSPAATTAEGFWFISLALITWSGAFAAFTENGVLGLTLTTLAAGATVFAVGLVGGVAWAETLAGYLFVISAIMAWYLATAMMLEGASGKVVLPLGKYQSDANIPGRSISEPVGHSSGMPGAKVGQ